MYHVTYDWIKLLEKVAGSFQIQPINFEENKARDKQLN